MSSNGSVDMRTPRARVAGLGSAREGVGHWWRQRVTAVALIPLAILFIPAFAATLGQGHDAVRALFANIYNALIAILFVAACFYHLALGLQVVIEDYVHAKGPRTALLLANSLGCALLGAAGVFAIARISFTG